MDGSRRPRQFDGVNPTPSFLFYTSCQAQSASPSLSHLFVLISLSRSLPLFLWYHLPPSPSPLNPCHCFFLLHLPRLQLLLAQVASMEQFPPSHFLGKSSSSGEPGPHSPRRCLGSAHVWPPGAMGSAGFAQSWRDPDGKPGMLPGPRITFLADFKALFQNIWARTTKEPCNNK